MVGDTEIGPDFQLIRSMTEYEAVFGTRQGFDQAYDGADVYFREGGNKLTVARSNTGAPLGLAEEPGPDLSDEALRAMSRADLDQAATELGVAEASDLPNREAVISAIKEQVTPAGQTVSHEQKTYAEALLAADPGIAAALAALTKDLGPGQIFVRHSLGSDVATQQALLAHAADTNRIALLHTADGDAASLVAAAAALRADANARYGALFAPHVTVPGVAGSTTRDVSYDPVVAGMMARNDVSYSPNVPAAGDLGQAQFATDVNLRFTDFDYQTLNEGGVDMARLIYGGVRTYGYRTLVDPASPAGVWLDLGNARLNMSIVAQADSIGEHYVFTQIDGRRVTINEFGGDLRAMLVPMYEAGALYGATPEEAFDVNVGPSVNTEETIANGELHAVIQVRMSPFAEWVVIEVVKVATTQAIAA